MGSVVSEEERRENIREVKLSVKKFKKCPDVMVNRAIVMFCSTSSGGLQQHLDKTKQTKYPTTDWMKTLAEKLAGLSPSPKLAGLGALAVAVFIDTTSFSPAEENTKEALRGVFAEEKAFEVWDQVDECLKRCIIHVNDHDELVSDIKRIEHQLSIALTRLKNSMVRDGHTSSQALKAWVNGAAFHIQMLIHLVRLGGTQTCDPVERLVSAYLSELDTLFEQHKATAKNKCKLRYDNFEDLLVPYFESEEGEVYYVARFVRFDEYFQAYYEEHYSSQKQEIRKYFRRIRDDLPGLVSQEGHLSVC